MGIGSLLKLGGRALKCVPEFIFGDSAHVIGKAYKAAPKGSIWSKAKVAGKAFESHVGKLSATKGGFLTRLWKNTVGLPKALNFSRKAGVRLAKMKGTSAFMGGLKGIGKGIAKKMPYIGAVLTLAFEVPNIIKGYKKEGVKGALKQAGGTGVELGCMAAGAAIGSCIPGVGTVIGGIVGGIVGMFARNAIAPEPVDEEVEEAEQETDTQDQEAEESSSSSSSSSSSATEGSRSSSDSSASDSSSSSSSSGSSSSSETTTPTIPTTPTITNPVTSFNPFGFGMGMSNPFGMGMGSGMYSPYTGSTGMFNSPITEYTNSLLQPGENIFLKYPLGFRFQYMGQ